MRRVKDDESGAVVVLFGVLLLAFAALIVVVVDVGRVAHERFQLQNGADAAALAIALDCAGSVGCPGDAQAEAARYLAANVATSGPSASVSIAGGPVSGTVTVEATNPELALSGDGGSTSVGTTAVAAWEPAGAATTIPLAIADCIWAASPLNGAEVTVVLRGSAGHGVDVDPPCDGVSGEAALLDGSGCESRSSVVGNTEDGWVRQSNVRPGQGTSWSDCFAAEGPYPVAVFGDWCGSGPKPRCPLGIGASGREVYEVAGYAFLRVTGTACGIGTAPEPDPLCTVSGVFVPGVLNATLPAGGEAFGASTVHLQD